MKRSITLLLFVAALSSGCAPAYITPGDKADLKAFAPADIQAGFDAQATAPFPAAIMAVRVQGASYTNHHLSRNGGLYGNGRYSVVTVREVEQESQFERIARLPQVSGVVGVNRMLLPETLNSDRELRMAASRLQADLVFVYTFATAFFDANSSKPLTVISFGFASTRQVQVTTTASALLLDTRTGYVYAAYEVTARHDAAASFWGSGDAADAGRRQTEAEAFDKLVGEVETAWPKLLARHAKKA